MLEKSSRRLLNTTGTANTAPSTHSQWMRWGRKEQETKIRKQVNYSGTAPQAGQAFGDGETATEHPSTLALVCAADTWGTAGGPSEHDGTSLEPSVLQPHGQGGA